MRKVVSYKEKKKKIQPTFFSSFFEGEKDIMEWIASRSDILQTRLAMR